MSVDSQDSVIAWEGEYPQRRFGTGLTFDTERQAAESGLCDCFDMLDLSSCSVAEADEYWLALSLSLQNKESLLLLQ